MSAKNYQDQITELLERSFSEVIPEWSVYKGASDPMKRVKSQYYPRVDVAIGPFNREPGVDSRIKFSLVGDRLPKLSERLSELERNPNPRCLLAIEVVFSGSAKHLLGDLLNSSAIGLYGVVVASDEMLPKVERNLKYVKKLSELSKIPHPMLGNVLVISATEFSSLIS